MSSAKLTFPQPPARPGESPDFSLLDIPAAGLLEVPPLDVTSDDCADYARGLIRVLDDNGQAVGPWAEYAKNAAERSDSCTGRIAVILVRFSRDRESTKK